MTDSPRERAARGAAKLKENGDHDEAAAIEAFLAPRGWMQLRDTDPSLQTETTPLSLTMTRALKSALEAAAKDFNWRLETLVEDGFRAALNGWLPPKTLRTVARGPLQKAQRELKQQTKTVLQLQVDSQLAQQVALMTEKLSQEAGYRVTKSSIAISWMCEELGIDRPTEEGRGVLRLLVRRSFAEHVATAAAKQGTTLAQVVEEGLRSLLDGSWTPQVSGWNVVESRPRGEGARWQPSSDKPLEVTKLTLPVEESLLEGLRVRAAEMDEDAKVPVHPGTVAIALLKDRLGEPAE